MKKLGFASIALSALLLSGCGGGDSKSTKEKIQERTFIVITHAYPDDICTSQGLKDELKTLTSVENIITSIEDNTVNCSYYGRSEGNTCHEQVLGGYPNACVVGVDQGSQKFRNVGEEKSKTIDDAMLKIF